MFPGAVQSNVLAEHGDLYRHHEDGFGTLHVRDGSVDFVTVLDAPFGAGFQPDASRFTSVSEWSPESLGT